MTESLEDWERALFEIEKRAITGDRVSMLALISYQRHLRGWSKDSWLLVGRRVS